MRRLSDVSFFSLTRGNGVSSALMLVASCRILITDAYESAFIKLAFDRTDRMILFPLPSISE